MSDSLEAIRAAIPKLACRGLCQAACGIVGCSRAEAAELQENGYSIPGYRAETGACTHLDARGRCGVYAHRPLICRLYGVVKMLRCPHGCVPERWLSDPEAYALLRRARDLTTGDGVIVAEPNA